MHELSIAMSIVELATSQAKQYNASAIEEIELDIGCLCGIEMDSFDFAWKQAIKKSVLEYSTRRINRIEGKAICLDCEHVFDMQEIYDNCPECKSQLVSILKGKELKLKSLVLPD